MSRYDDEEYANIIKASEGSGVDWSKQETDYLFELCERFDLRFPVVADRYEVSVTLSMTALHLYLYACTACCLTAFAPVRLLGGPQALCMHVSVGSF